MSENNEINNLQDLLGDLSQPDEGDKIEFIAVIGAGVMGQGIARTISAAGIDVVMIEKKEERIEEALQNLTNNMEHEISRWAMTKSEMKSIMSRIKWSLDMNQVKDADFVSLHTPLTDSTRGMMNKDVFAVMKKHAVIINTGRGDCVDADDMAAALENGDLKAYGTDVWPSDPPPENYPLLKTPNVFMLPHITASISPGDILFRQISGIKRLLRRVLPESVLSVALSAAIFCRE